MTFSFVWLLYIFYQWRNIAYLLTYLIYRAFAAELKLVLMFLISHFLVLLFFYSIFKISPLFQLFFFLFFFFCTRLIHLTAGERKTMKLSGLKIKSLIFNCANLDFVIGFMFILLLFTCKIFWICFSEIASCSSSRILKIVSFSYN